MQINLAKSAGFCFGVKRALSIAQKLAKSGVGVEMLGDIVHNEEVAKQIYRLGIKKVRALQKGKNKIFLIRAHGTCQKIIKKATNLGYEIMDATCPMVKEIHKIVERAELEGYTIIIIGDKDHDEVHGIAGQLRKKAIVIESSQHLRLSTIRGIKKACVVVQSTQNLDHVLGVLKILKSHIKDLKFFNTVCSPTRLKQEEIRSMPKDNDVMIIIGSKTSANTKRLYEISKSLNQYTYWVQSKKDISPAWFKAAQKIGVTSGASTPDITTQGVINNIRRITD